TKTCWLVGELRATMAPSSPALTPPQEKKETRLAEATITLFFLRGRREQSTKEARLAEKSTFKRLGVSPPAAFECGRRFAVENTLECTPDG
ncbi:MAG: hypothetical protein ACKOUR_17595, partial [Planctomycetota bacterium]